MKLFITISAIATCFHLNIAFALNQTKSNNSEIEIIEILTTLQDEKYWPMSPLQLMSGIPTKEMLDNFEARHPEVAQARELINQMDTLIQQEHSVEFMLSLINTEKRRGLNITPLIEKVIKKQITYADNSIFLLLKKVESDDCHYYSICRIALDAFIKRGNVPSYIESYMINNNSFKFNYIGKVSISLDYQIIEDEISSLIESQDYTHITNSLLNRLSVNDYLGKFKNDVEHNNRMPISDSNRPHIHYPQWQGNLELTIADLRLIQQLLKEY